MSMLSARGVAVRSCRASAPLVAALAGLLLLAPVAGAQGAATLTAAELRKLAETHLLVGAVHDSADVEASRQRNKTRDKQAELAELKRKQLAAVLEKQGMTADAYQRQRYLVSSNNALRATFDSLVAVLTGAPLPGTVVAQAPAAGAASAAGAAGGPPGAIPNAQLPAGLVGTHIGHLGTTFPDTPDKWGLLPTAVAEATIAQQHAAFAARTPADLASMQRHAAHVLHALDPSVEKQGPGRGFGVKRAANNAATHIELAAKEPTASANVKTHAVHVATASRAVAARVDVAVSLAQKIRAAGTAAEAAGLVSQLVSLCGQLTAGVDANADGRIGWDAQEGGLQQAQQHLQLMVNGERK
jgi:hypothetical protein